MKKKKDGKVIAGDTFYQHIWTPLKGERPKYSPIELLLTFDEYCKWCKENPLYGQKVVDKELVPEARMRAMTEVAFCLWAGVHKETFRLWKLGAVEEGYMQDAAIIIADCIYQQKFSGAAADMLNANIISRDLGLADKREVKTDINLSDSAIEFE